MGYKVYTNEFKAEVSKFYQTHTLSETMSKYGVSDRSVTLWSRKLGYPAKPRGVINFSNDFKHEVCQYYENHTWKETIAKYDISAATLFEWRKTYGYKNKSRGYNLYMEGLQPTVTKRERRNFVMTKDENGDLKAKIEDLEYKLSAMEVVVTSTLYGLTEEIKSTLEAFDL